MLCQRLRQGEVYCRHPWSCAWGLIAATYGTNTSDANTQRIWIPHPELNLCGPILVPTRVANSYNELTPDISPYDLCPIMQGWGSGKDGAAAQYAHTDWHQWPVNTSWTDTMCAFTQLYFTKLAAKHRKHRKQTNSKTQQKSFKSV